jgi:hypothetical protein
MGFWPQNHNVCYWLALMKFYYHYVLFGILYHIPHPELRLFYRLEKSD